MMVDDRVAIFYQVTHKRSFNQNDHITHKIDISATGIFLHVLHLLEQTNTTEATPLLPPWPLQYILAKGTSLMVGLFVGFFPLSIIFLSLSLSFMLLVLV